ncbi:hypothetical protein JCM10908_005270 [Rhodotorula pacifica]|uniref:Zn(II)2Cys6 transcription factor n=1 Tax=Rhodotorula pacifica TaxID=1495444 RepID=UPI003179F079
MSGQSVPSSLQPTEASPALPVANTASTANSPSSSTTEPVRAPPTAGTSAAVPEKRRTSFPACARCRRGKIKCVAGENGQLPCAACVTRGLGAMCTRAEPGSSVHGADIASDGSKVRQRKRRAEEDYAYRSGKSPIAHLARLTPYPGATEVHALDEQYGRYGRPGPTYSRNSASPPQTWQSPPEDVRAVFVTQFHQLGFLHRPTFLHELQTRTDANSPFLLLSMLALSARSTSAIVDYFGSPGEATQFFLSRALGLLPESLQAPTLERVQGLYVLSLVESAEGNTYRSKMLLGLARSMAFALALDRTDGEAGPADAPIIDQEVRRRTWWCLQVQLDFESVSGGEALVAQPLPSIPLPMDEQEFVFGTSSKESVYVERDKGVPLLQKPAQISLLGLLILSRMLFSDVVVALRRAERRTTTHDGIEGLQSRLLVIQSSLTPLQLATSSNFLAYRSQNLDVDFHELHLNLLATSMLTQAMVGKNVVTGADLDTREGPAAQDLASELANKVEELLGARPSLVLPPIFAFYLHLAAEVLLTSSAEAGVSSERLRMTFSRIIIMLEDAAMLWPVARPWAHTLSIKYGARFRQKASISPLPHYTVQASEPSATNAASTLAALARSKSAGLRDGSTSPQEDGRLGAHGWAKAHGNTSPQLTTFAPPRHILAPIRHDGRVPTFPPIRPPEHMCDPSDLSDDRISARFPGRKLNPPRSPNAYSSAERPRTLLNHGTTSSTTKSFIEDGQRTYADPSARREEVDRGQAVLA